MGVGGAVAAGLAAAALAAAPAGAATFTVNTTQDLASANCSGPGAPCSLRGALVAAKSVAGRDTVALPPGTYDNTGNDFIVAIGEAVDVVGSGARATVVREASGGDGRVFLVEQDARLGLSDLTVADARAGSGILMFGGGNEVSATRTTFRGNRSVDGGALSVNGGRAMLAESTLAANTASGRGGAVYAGGEGSSVSLVSSTVTGNTAPAGAAVHAERGATALTSSTVMGNNGPGGAGVADLFLAPAASGTVERSVLEDCAGRPPSSLGWNLAATSCGLAGPTDRTGDPQVDPLADNGGPTDTLAPRPGSPVIDAGGSCGPHDQRGVRRPQGLACDVGAFEAEHPVLGGLRIAPTRFRAASGGPAMTAATATVAPGEAALTATAGGRPPVGGRVRFELDQPATVVASIVRLGPGRRTRAGACVRPTRGNAARPRCVRAVAYRSTLTRVVPAGPATFRLRGRLAGRRLPPGPYRLRLAPYVGVRRGTGASVSFRIVP